MDNPVLSLRGVCKSFGENRILNDLSLDVYKGEFITLLGESGCGKTTTLRCVAGLESVGSGDILLDGVSVKDMPPDKRNVNTVFQNYALFPHMNVYDNIAYGPNLRRAAKNEIRNAVAEMLELVKMTGYEKRMPSQLSGGQRQRVAIARALINKPLILLLDEPLGALDLKLRQHMQAELKSIQSKAGVTFIYVTHDQDEALNMSDRIGVMDAGRFVQIGTPHEIYESPNSLFTAKFVGDRNVLSVKVEEQKPEFTSVSCGGIKLLARKNEALKPGDTAFAVIHTDRAAMLSGGAKPDNMNIINGVIQSSVYTGSRTKTTVLINGDFPFIIIEYNNAIGQSAAHEGEVCFALNPRDIVLV